MVETVIDWMTAAPVTRYDAVGLAGVALYVVAYCGVQVGRIDGNGPGYAALNGLAAAGVLVSMAGAFNLAGALVNALFLTFSAIGLARYVCAALRLRRRLARQEMQAALAAPVEAQRAVWFRRRAAAVDPPNGFPNPPPPLSLPPRRAR